MKITIYGWSMRPDVAAIDRRVEVRDWRADRVAVTTSMTVGGQFPDGSWDARSSTLTGAVPSFFSRAEER
jgi:hypothetical protein